MSANNWTMCPSCKREDEFREDYEIGVWGGNFYVNYGGWCQACNFKINYIYQKDVIEMGENEADQ